MWKTSVTCTTICSQIDRGIPFSVYPSSAPHPGRYIDHSYQLVFVATEQCVCAADWLTLCTKQCFSYCVCEAFPCGGREFVCILAADFRYSVACDFCSLTTLTLKKERKKKKKGTHIHTHTNTHTHTHYLF